jgi:hypothetical protein
MEMHMNKITLDWKPARVRIPEFPAEKTSKIFSVGYGSPFTGRDGNILPWLPKKFPSSPAVRVERARIPAFADNKMLFAAMGGERVVRTLYRAWPQQIRFLAQMAYKNKSLFLRNKFRTLFVVENSDDGKLFVIGVSWKKGFVPYIFNGEELSRAWSPGNLIYRIIQSDR